MKTLTLVILDFLAVALIVWGFVLAVLDGLCWIAHDETDGPLR